MWILVHFKQLPGGRVTVTQERIRISTHAVCVVFMEIKEDGVVLVSRMRYTKDNRTSIRQIMETGDPGETVMQTLFSAVTHEGAKSLGDFEWETIPKSPTPVFTEIGPDKEDPKGLHLKEVYIVRVLKGELRDFVLVDGDETLGPITMVPVDELLKEIENRTVPFHIKATRAALSYVASNQKVLDRYFKEIVKSQPSELTPKEERLIGEYIWK